MGGVGVAEGLRLPGGQRREGSWAGLACFWAPAAHACLRAAWSILAAGHPQLSHPGLRSC